MCQQLKSRTFTISTQRTHQRPERANPISRWHRPRQCRTQHKLAPTGKNILSVIIQLRPSIYGESQKSPRLAKISVPRRGMLRSIFLSGYKITF